VSRGFHSSEVTGLIHQYKAGEMTLDQLAERFRTRRWLHTMQQPPQTYLEMAARSQQDPDPYEPNSFDDVVAAYDSGELDRNEFRVLKAAVLEAGRAEDRGEL
jgi:hypothetical protein